MDYISIATILRMYGFELIRNIYNNEYIVYDLSNYNMIPLNIFLSKYFINSIHMHLNLYPYNTNYNYSQPPAFIPYNALIVDTPKPNINTVSSSSPKSIESIESVKSVKSSKSSKSLTNDINKNRSRSYKLDKTPSDIDSKDWRFF